VTAAEVVLRGDARISAAPSLVVFDADGTLRWTTVPGQRCPHRPDEWRLMPGVDRVLRDLRAGGTRLAVASNQNDVALGFLTREAAQRMLEDTVEAACGTRPSDAIVALCTCPPASDCPCRKPRPGMLEGILAQAGVAPAHALMVGDLDIDRRAAEAAGMPFRWAAEYFGWTR
jgi:D-glycero-D-manno-heptose 1,7-bisphosphate phosphatase